MVLLIWISAASEINTSCYVNSNNKSYFSSYSKVFSADVKYSTFKTPDPLSVLYNGLVHTSCTHKSKCDITTYRETPFKLW